jgi:hypothetical protein
MKKRYIYALLFGAPGFFVALIISFLVFGALAGAFWIFMFGDNTWPSSTGVILTALLIITFLIVSGAVIWVGFSTGKKLEKDPELNTSHVFISVGMTLIFVFVIVLQQLSVGNLGPKPDSLVCGRYCSLNGYSSSGMPPLDSGDRTCFCYDDFGNEVIKIPLDEIPSDDLE